MGRASIFVSFILAGIWHFTGHYVWEFGRAVLYEKAWHMIEPSVPTPFLFQYGPSTFLVLLGALLWRDAKGRPKFWQSSRDESTESSSRSLIDDQKTKTLAQSKLRISTGETGPFMKTKSRGLYATKRTLYLGIDNDDPENVISGIKIAVLTIEPQLEYMGPWILDENLSLPAGDHKFIPLVSYGEADSGAYSTSRYERSDTDFQLVTGNDFATPGFPKDTQQIFLIRATGVGSAPCDYRCKVWVDRSDARLRIANVVHSDEFIPLREAAIRAHERLRYRPISIPTEVFATSADEIIIAYCKLLAKPARGEPLVTMHGTMPPSRIVEPIDTSHLTNFDFLIENGDIILQDQRKERQWKNLSVNETELATAIDELSRKEV